MYKIEFFSSTYHWNRELRQEEEKEWLKKRKMSLLGAWVHDLYGGTWVKGAQQIRKLKGLPDKQVSLSLSLFVLNLRALNPVLQINKLINIVRVIESPVREC